MSASRFRSTRRDWREALINFALFGIIAIPIGLVTGFIKPSTALPSLLEIVGRGIAIFLFIALPEEILFRGVIHRYLERVLRWAQRADVDFVVGHLRRVASQQSAERGLLLHPRQHRGLLLRAHVFAHG